MCFMALVTALVFCARSQDSLAHFQCQCARYMSLSILLDLRMEESRVLRHVKRRAIMLAGLDDKRKRESIDCNNYVSD